MWISDGIHDNPFHIRRSSPPCFLLQERPPCLIKTPAGNWKIDFSTASPSKRPAQFHGHSTPQWWVSYKGRAVINCHVNSVNVTTSDGNYEFPERQMVEITTTMSAGSPSWILPSPTGREPPTSTTATQPQLYTTRRRGRKLEFITVKVAIDWPLDSVYTYSYHNPFYVTSSSSVLLLNCL